MKRLWPYIYLSLTAATFLSGIGLFGEEYDQTNVDWVFITISLFISAIFPLMAVVYARNRAVSDLPQPSLSRGFVGGWWKDPWQCLLLTTLLSCSWFLGSLFTLSHANHQGIMIVGWKGAIALGSVVGSLLAHNRFRGDVT